MAHLFLFSADDCWHNITTFIPQRKRSGTIAVLLCIFHTIAVAEFERTIVPPACTAGGSGGWFESPADAFLRNPSFLSVVEGMHGAVYYHPSPFGLQQLSGGGFAVVIPFKEVAVGCSGTTFGFSLYRELTGTLSVAHRFGTSFSLGFAMTVDRLSIARYGNASAVEADLGLTVLLSEVCSWDVAATNILRATMGQGKDPLPQYYSTGIEYVPVSEIHLKCELRKDVRYPASFSSTIAVTPLDVLSFFAGVTTEPSRFCGGIEVRCPPVGVRYAVLTHAELGLSHVVGCSFDF